MSRSLHIICANLPWPTNCSASIEVINRIKAFQQSGVDIHLHYFSDGTQSVFPPALGAICASVNVYKKKPVFKSFSLKLPYPFLAHVNTKLISTLQKDNHPILFEGLRVTGILEHINTGNRKICVRIHKDEVIHNKELSRTTINPLKKIYYKAGSSFVNKYIGSLVSNISFACITESDCVRMREGGVDKAFHIPAFSNWQEVNCPDGIGNLCLFHGDLSEAENEKAALWLLCNVFNKVRVPFVIAGKKPSRRLRKTAELCQHTCVVSDPTDQELDDLIHKAHINVLPFLCKNITGSRLKLLHALYKGRHCVVNPAMVEGTGLEEACHIGKNSNAIASIISQLYYQPFNEEEIILRKNLLYKEYNNEENLERFTDLLW